MSNQIIIQNIYFGADQQDIINFISSSTSNINSIKIQHDSQGRTKGTAFVKYNTHDDAKKAVLSLNNIILKGHKIKAYLIDENSEIYSPLNGSENNDDLNEDFFSKVHKKMHSKTDKIYKDMLENPYRVLNNPLYSFLIEEKDRKQISKLADERKTILNKAQQECFFSPKSAYTNTNEFVFTKDEVQNTDLPQRTNIATNNSPRFNLFSSKTSQNIKTSQNEFTQDQSFNSFSESQGNIPTKKPVFNLFTESFSRTPWDKTSSNSFELQQNDPFQTHNYSPFKKTSLNSINEEQDDSPIENDESEDDNSNESETENTSFTNHQQRGFSQISREFMPSSNTHFSQVELINQEVFQENVRIVQTGQFTDKNGKHHDISSKVSESISNSITIPKNYSYEKDLSDQLKQTKQFGSKEKNSIYSKIEVTNESTFEAARRWKRSIKEVCVLNFASPTKPGGGVINGRTAQEEALSRQSTLFFSLKQQNEMYDYNKRHPSPFASDYMIYSPNVVVFRDDDNNLIYPLRVSVISSPAVNCSQISGHHNNGDIYKCMKNRCRKILQLTLATNNKVIVLGAFGCGVFGNKPEEISKIFKELLIDEFYGMFFTKIVFAIKGKYGKRNYNLDAFKKTFKQKWF